MFIRSRIGKGSQERHPPTPALKMQKLSKQDKQLKHSPFKRDPFMSNLLSCMIKCFSSPAVRDASYEDERWAPACEKEIHSSAFSVHAWPTALTQHSDVAAVVVLEPSPVPVSERESQDTSGLTDTAHPPADTPVTATLAKLQLPGTPELQLPAASTERVSPLVASEQPSPPASAQHILPAVEKELPVASEQPLPVTAEQQVPAVQEQQVPVAAQSTPKVPVEKDKQDSQEAGQAVPTEGSTDNSYTLGYACKQGASSKMEDRIVTENFKNPFSEYYSIFKDNYNAAFLAVLDGHAGTEAVDWLQTNLLATFVGVFIELAAFPAFLARMPISSESVQLSLSEALLRCERELLALGYQSGSTAVVTLMLDAKLYTANVGDSRAVLSQAGKATQVTNDHSISSGQEKQRLLDAGATFTADGYLRLDCQGCSDLSVTRDLGSAHIKAAPGAQSLVLPTPDLFEQDIAEDSEFIILACDGVWDKFANGDAARDVRRWLSAGKTPEEAAASLCDDAVARGSTDNVSAVVLRFSSRPFKRAATGNSMLGRRRPLAGQ